MYASLLRGLYIGHPIHEWKKQLCRNTCRWFTVILVGAPRGKKSAAPSPTCQELWAHRVCLWLWVDIHCSSDAGGRPLRAAAHRPEKKAHRHLAATGTPKFPIPPFPLPLHSTAHPHLKPLHPRANPLAASREGEEGNGSGGGGSVAGSAWLLRRARWAARSRAAGSGSWGGC
jgi:hypothetical protein